MGFVHVGQKNGNTGHNEVLELFFSPFTPLSNNYQYGHTMYHWKGQIVG